MSNKLGSFDILGNIAVLKFDKKAKSNEKKKLALDLMKKQKSITTVVEKVGKFKGLLRKMQTKHVIGEKTKEVLYRENGCVFRFNLDSTYFSPRLSNERKEISNLVKKDSNVLVMFAGVAPYSIVIGKSSKAKKVYSLEINREATKYAKLNVELNKLKEKVEVIQGDVKRVSEKMKKQNMKFDYIVMPRPNLKYSFLKEAFALSKKGTLVYYYGFCKVEDKEKLVEQIKEEAGKAGKKIKILKVKEAGEIAPYKARFRVDFIVL